MWMSIFDRPDHSRFSRVQRVTVCVTLVYVYMCASALWYGLLKGGGTAQDPVTWAALGWEEVVVAVAAALITLPAGLLLVLIFKKSRPKVCMHALNISTSHLHAVNGVSMVFRSVLIGFILFGDKKLF